MGARLVCVQPCCGRFRNNRPSCPPPVTGARFINCRSPRAARGMWPCVKRRAGKFHTARHTRSLISSSLIDSVRARFINCRSPRAARGMWPCVKRRAGKFHRARHTRSLISSSLIDSVRVKGPLPGGGVRCAGHTPHTGRESALSQPTSREHPQSECSSAFVSTLVYIHNTHLTHDLIKYMHMYQNPKRPPYQSSAIEFAVCFCDLAGYPASSECVKFVRPRKRPARRGSTRVKGGGGAGRWRGGCTRGGVGR